MKKISLLLITMFAVMFLAACQTNTQTAESMEAEGDAEMAASEAEMMERERELNTREHELAKKEKMMGEGSAESVPVTAASGDLYPPNARPGECYARMLIPSEHRTVTEKVLKREASEKVQIIPASYKIVTKRVMVKPETTKLVEVPAQYGTKTERVQISPAQTVWKKGAGTLAAAAGTGAQGGESAAAIQQRFGNQKIIGTRTTDTGELMCLVEIPAQYKTVSKIVLTSPATTKQITTPAEYKTVQVTELVTAAQEKRIAIPEEYGTVTRTELVRAEQLTWVPVLCQVNMTNQNVTQLQTALKKQGCYECKVDGIMGPCTFRGSQCFAKRKGLPFGTNFVTLETISALGLKF